MVVLMIVTLTITFLFFRYQFSLSVSAPAVCKDSREGKQIGIFKSDLAME